MGRRYFLVLDCNLYDVYLCAYVTGLMMFESANFGGGGCSGTDILRTDTVSETTLGAVVGWVATTADGGVNHNVNLG